MSVRIRLRRVGRKKQPYFRVVVAKGDAPRDGAYIDEVGFYNPRTRPAFLTMDLAKVDDWIARGAEVSESAHSLIRKARKGGDETMRFVKPGEELPSLKTATKPERRPTASASPAQTPEGEPAEKTDPLEGAAPDAEKAPPAEAPRGGATEEAVAATETQSPKSGKAETDKDKAAADAPGAEAKTEEKPVEDTPADAPEGKAEVKAAVEPKAETSEEPEAKTEAQAEAETESEAPAEEPKAEAKAEAKAPKKKASKKAEPEDEAEAETAAEEGEEK